MRIDWEIAENCAPNQRRSGSMRVLGSSLDWRSCFNTFPLRSRFGLVLYILSRRTVAAERTPLSPPPLLRFTSSECFGFPETLTCFSFFFFTMARVLKKRKRRGFWGAEGKGMRCEEVELGFGRGGYTSRIL